MVTFVAALPFDIHAFFINQKKTIMEEGTRDSTNGHIMSLNITHTNIIDK